MWLTLAIVAFVAGGATVPLLLEYLKAKEERANLAEQIKRRGLVGRDDTKLVQLPCCGLFTTGDPLQHARPMLREIEKLKVMPSDFLPAVVRSQITQRDEEKPLSVAAKVATDYFMGVFAHEYSGHNNLLLVFPTFVPNWSCHGHGVAEVVQLPRSDQLRCSMPVEYGLVPRLLSAHPDTEITDNGALVVTRASVPLDERELARSLGYDPQIDPFSAFKAATFLPQDRRTLETKIGEQELTIAALREVVAGQEVRIQAQNAERDGVLLKLQETGVLLDRALKSKHETNALIEQVRQNYAVFVMHHRDAHLYKLLPDEWV